MNDELIPILAAQVAADRRLLADARLLGALLNDLAPELRSARHLVVRAVEAGVVAGLLQLDATVDALTINRLAALLAEEFSVTEQAARWAVGAWCQALGKRPLGAPPALPANGSGGAPPQDDGAPELLAAFASHHPLVFGVAWHPRGTVLASCGADSFIRVWAAEDHGAFVVSHTLLAPSAWVTAVGWTRPGNELATLGENQVNWWTARGKLRRTLGRPFTVARWAPDGALVALARHQTIRLWHAPREREERRLSETPQLIEALAWSGDGALLAAAGSAGVADVWQAADGRHAGSFQHAGYPGYPLGDAGALALAWHPRRAELAWAGERGLLALADVATQTVRPLPSGLATIRSLAWSADGALLAAGDGDGRLEIWRAADGRLAHGWQAHGRAAYGLAWHPRSRLLASGAGDGMIKLWEVGR